MENRLLILQQPFLGRHGFDPDICALEDVCGDGSVIGNLQWFLKKKQVYILS
jgi:hypothetical protein